VPASPQAFLSGSPRRAINRCRQRLLLKRGSSTLIPVHVGHPTQILWAKWPTFLRQGSPAVSFSADLYGSLHAPKVSEVQRMRLMLLIALTWVPRLEQDNEPANRLYEAADVFSEIMNAPDSGIPLDLLDRAHCIVIVPGLKSGAFVFGGKYGKGYLSCRRNSRSGWSAPGTVRVEGGSFGFQIGASETDVVMLVMSEDGVRRLLSSRFTLGAEGSVAAGPVGRFATAQTDLQLHADILSWSRSRGLLRRSAGKVSGIMRSLTAQSGRPRPRSGCSGC
jgi:SH3 domain-containing YSC84-like protein 1